MKYLLVILVCCSLLGCSSPQAVTEIKCPEIYKNGFSEILSEKHHTIDGRDTLSFNQLRFQCAHSALYTSKVMYDRFGKWNKEILPRNRKHPILVWENVDLLSNGRKYNVMTDGLEEYKNIYASVMVFDNDGKDILSGSSTEKVTIAGFFADLIKNNNDGKEGFYEVYWESVDPKRWKMIQRHRNM